MQVTFLFWNIMKRPLYARLAKIVSAHNVDIVLLAECADEPEKVLDALNGAPPGGFCFPTSEDSKIRIFTRFEASTIRGQFDNPIGGWTIRRLHLDRTPNILLTAVHFPSRVNQDRDDQSLMATILAEDIVRTEKDTGIFRTLVVGDLNMNPFDTGVSGAMALHATMTRQVATREQRTVAGKTYRFFYNPMWGFFGDRTVGPPGTYYLASSKPVNYFWNMYDQVLLRPELMDSLRNLRILDSDGEDTLVTKAGRPQKSNGSDHLPLLFQLEL